MEIPDLQGGYSLSNNAINAVMTVIDDCLEHDNFNVPEYIPLQMLGEEIINTQLSLKAANAQRNQNDILKLTKLYEIVQDMSAQWTTEAQNEAMAEQPQPMPEQAPQMVEQGDVQLPYQENILTQENNMQPVDMDLQTQNVPGNWNQQPVQAGFP